MHNDNIVLLSYQSDDDYKHSIKLLRHCIVESYERKELNIISKGSFFIQLGCTPYRNSPSNSEKAIEKLYKM